MRLPFLKDACCDLLSQALHFACELPQPAAWIGLLAAGMVIYRLLGNSRSSPSRPSW